MFGSLYNNLDLGIGRQIAALPTLYLLRRLALAVSVVYQNSFIVQILALFIGLVAQFSLLGMRPHLDEKETSKFD